MGSSVAESASLRHPVLPDIGRPHMAKATVREPDIDWLVVLGRALQRAVAIAGWSNKEAAAKVGVDDAEFGKWLNASRRPHIDRVIAVDELRGPVLHRARGRSGRLRRHRHHGHSHSTSEGTMTDLRERPSEPKTAHTPGPWQMKLHGAFGDDGKPSVAVFIEAGEYHSIALVIPTDAVQANARLIAAAPELLNACKHALVIAQEYDETGFAGTIVLKDMLRVAIAKAEA